MSPWRRGWLVVEAATWGGREQIIGLGRKSDARGCSRGEESEGISPGKEWRRWRRFYVRNGKDGVAGDFLRTRGEIELGEKKRRLGNTT